MSWKTGDEFIISELKGDVAVVERLRELGFTTGESFRVVQKSPFGEPIILQVRGTTVALRKSELACIVIS